MDVLFAGAVSGIVSTLICHPLDVIRTLIQLNPDRHRNAFTCYSEVMRANGYKFYSGILPPLIAQTLYKSCIFSTNYFVDRIRRKLEIEKSKSMTFLGGTIAGIVNSIFVTPVEFVRNLLMEDQAAAQSMSDNFRLRNIQSIISRHKFGLFKGLSVTMTRDGLGLGLYFLVFSECMKARSTMSPNAGQIAHKFDWIGVLMSGAMAGIGFWLIALPIDTIKTLVQSRSLGEAVTIRSAMNQAKFKTVRKCLPVALVRGIVGASLTLGTYNLILFNLNLDTK